MEPIELRCQKDEHPLTVTKNADGLLHIAAPACSAACECCQRVGSLDFSLPSLFVPGRT